MLKCLHRYRSESRGLFVEPGEVLRDLTPEQEEALLRDSPDSFQRVKASKALDAPPEDRMVHRERAVRKGSETGLGPIMTRDNMQGLVKPKG